MDIYEYDNYRQYLSDLYEHRKAVHGKYSYRIFAQEAGFSNPGFFNDVVRGARKLSQSACDKIIAVFEMPSKQAEFFRLLVQYDQEKKEEEKQLLLSQIQFRRSRSNFARLNPAMSKYYQDYRYPLVRAAVEAFRFRGDYVRLAAFIRPPLPVNLVRKCVRDLCDWGLLRQNSDGLYEVTQKFVEPSPRLSEHIRRLNKAWISQGAQAIDEFLPSERHISTIMLNVSKKTADEVTRKIEEFREEVFRMIRADQEPECVMQLSLQYFPRTKIKGE